MGIGWTPLSEPRRLTAAEQAVLDRMVGHVGCAELTAQAASVWVTAVCECGCASVRLRSDAPVVVHVTGGSLDNLEIFAGEGVAVEVPSPDELDAITVM